MKVMKSIGISLPCLARPARRDSQLCVVAGGLFFLLAPGFAAPTAKLTEKSTDKTPVTAAPAAKPSPKPASSLPYVAALPASSLKAPVVKLPNGAVLVTRIDRLAPRVAISLLFKAGASDEDAKNAGWRRFLADAMLRGSVGPDGKAGESRDVRRMAESLGGSAGATVGDDQIEFWAVGNSASQAELLDLVLRMALHPRLSDDDIQKARQRLLSRLDVETSDIPSQAVNALRDRLYRNAADEPAAYGLPSNGLESSVKSLDATQLRRLHAAFFRPEKLVAAFTGDINQPLLRERLESIAKGGEVGSAGLPAGLPPQLAPPSSDHPPLVVKQYPSNAQVPMAWLFAGYALPPISSDDAPALRVLCVILGEMPRSRLERRLMKVSLIPEDDEVMVFQAATQWTARRWAGEMVVFAQTRSSDIEGAKNALLDEVTKMRDTAPTDPEMERAKNYLRGAWATEREGLRERAFQTALAPVLSGADPKYSDVEWTARIAKVTAEDVRRVAGKYLKNYAMTLIMPED
jgi:zinc protease